MLEREILFGGVDRRSKTLERSIRAYLEVDGVSNSVLEDGGLAGRGSTLAGGSQEGCEGDH